DDTIISAPNINSPIGKSGVIYGKFTQADLVYLISTLNAGSLPARLSDEPISESSDVPIRVESDLKPTARSLPYLILVLATAAALIFSLRSPREAPVAKVAD